MRQPGEPAKLYLDSATPVIDGDYTRTPTGRTYLVLSVRIQERGKHRGRQHLNTVVMKPDHVAEADARVHKIRWYRR